MQEKITNLKLDKREKIWQPTLWVTTYFLSIFFSADEGLKRSLEKI